MESLPRGLRRRNRRGSFSLRKFGPGGGLRRAGLPRKVSGDRVAGDSSPISGSTPGSLRQACFDRAELRARLDHGVGSIYPDDVSSGHETAPLEVGVKLSSARERAAKPGVTCHPQGPLLYRVEARRPATARLVAALTLAACLALLILAAWLHPDPRGVGTHQQLGFPTCTMIALFGYPCPTCGMTTAFAHTVRGQLISAFQAQPAGLFMAVGTLLAAVVSLGVLVTGKVWLVNWYRVSPARVTLALIAVVLASWVYKLVAGILSGTLPVGR